jgi:AcrR family transcriptional regulator
MPRAKRPATLSLSARLARNEIVGAAVGVFSRMGFRATRVEDVIAAAGISRRTFYKYFAGKDEVLAAIYEVATGELLGAMRAAAESSADPLDGLRLGLDVYLEFHVQNATLVRILVEQGMRADSALAPLRKLFRARLVELAARTTVGAPAEPWLHLALISAMEGLSLELLDTGHPDARDVARAKHAAHTLLDRVLGGERAKPAHGRAKPRA